jgi:hypothetical protein
MVRHATMTSAPVGPPDSLKLYLVPGRSTQFPKRVRHDHFHTRPSGGDQVPYLWWYAALEARLRGIYVKGDPRRRYNLGATASVADKGLCEGN